MKGRSDVKHASNFFRGMQRRLLGENLGLPEHILFEERGELKTAAATLLNPTFQEDVPQVVLEGAPGQGKSTIAQYLCQIHRIRILKNDKSISESYLNIPVRIPFKVDLRDLAAWLSKDNPFSTDKEAQPHSQDRTLEGFLAALVANHSGGANFSVADMHAVMEITPVLLVLDGLDEVAKISQRQEVVTAVKRGIGRLKAIQDQLQVIITSRPAAFSNSPGFSEDDFVYLELLPLNRLLIDEYAEKWTIIQQLDNKVKSELKKTLRVKLDQPHLRELAKNPMQLAILLSLLHTRGVSLPDKRTRLYSAYMELFFNREAEKSTIVREHRDLLQQIHGYLAWTLHSEAEQGENGRVNSERLRKLVEDYLLLEEYDISLVEELFQGMVERVVAIVSRVEGTFEFEVQPIREYFAAHYLYETAPYSPAGDEKTGTRPDRFDAIAQNFYWLNVTRFYAGFYSKGELASLIDRIKDLVGKDGYKYISHPRNLTAMLLSDYVFSQDRKRLREVIDLVLNRLGLRHLLGSIRSRRGALDSVLSLPEQCGRSELIEKAFEILFSVPAYDYRREVQNIIIANAGVEERLKQWRNYTSKIEGSLKGYWLEQALQLEILHKLRDDEVGESFLISEDEVVCGTLLRARRESILNTSEEIAQKAIDLILDGTVSLDNRVKTPYEALSFSLDAARFSIAIKARQAVQVPLSELAFQIVYIGDFADYAYTGHRQEFEDIEWSNYNLGNLSSCVELFELTQELLELPSEEWGTQLKPWNLIVEKSRELWGERWLHYEFATIASGIKSRTETCRDFSNLLDHSVSMCCRARYARRRSGANSSHWWEEQITKANRELENCFVILVLMTWGKVDLVVNLLPQIDKVISEVSPEEWQQLTRSLQRSINIFAGDTKDYRIDFDVESLPQELSNRTVILLGFRATPKTALGICLKYLGKYSDRDPIILEFLQATLLRNLGKRKPLELHHLDVIRKAYAEGIVGWYTPRYSRYIDSEALSLEVATAIVKEPNKYPQELVANAEARWRQEVASKIAPVAEIAKSEHWFDN